MIPGLWNCLRGLFTAAPETASIAIRLDHRCLQLATRPRIDRGIDRLVADAAIGIIGMHAPEFARDLFRRSAQMQQLTMDPNMQRAAFDQPAGPATSQAA